jgi:hypothetical protein
MKERNYDALLAGMRPAPTLTSAEEVIRTQPKIKLPDRRAITLWNSPELGEFRGVGEDLERNETRKHAAAVERLDIDKAAREQGATVPDINFVHQAAQQEQRQAPAMAQHAGEMRGMVDHATRAMAAEMKKAMEEVLMQNAAAANKQRVAEEAARGFRDTMAADMDRLRAQAAAVVPPPVLPPNVTNNTVINQSHLEERSEHNAVINMMRFNMEHIGANMHAQNQSAAEVLADVREAVREQKQTQQNLTQPVVFHMQPNVVNNVVTVGGGPPPTGWRSRSRSRDEERREA